MGSFGGGSVGQAGGRVVGRQPAAGGHLKLTIACSDGTLTVPLAIDAAGDGAAFADVPAAAVLASKTEATLTVAISGRTFRRPNDV